MNIEELEIDGLTISSINPFWIPVYWNSSGDPRWVFGTNLTYISSDNIQVAAQFETSEELKEKFSQAGAMKVWRGFDKAGQTYYIFDPKELANVKFFLEVHWPHEPNLPDEDIYIYRLHDNKHVHFKFSINKRLVPTDDRFALIAEEM